MPWAPGQSGNPHGRPRRRPYRDALLAKLKELEETGVISMGDIARQHILDSLHDLGARKELIDRVDGKVPVPVVGDDDGDPVTVRTIVTGVPREGE